MSAALAYAQARLQARYAEAPEQGDWAALESALHFASALERACQTKLAAWVADLSADSDAHEIEQALRRQWRRSVEEVARWLPPAWGSALHWTRWLVDLPALALLMRGEPAPAWMRRDPVLEYYSGEDQAERRSALGRGETAVLLSAWEAGAPLLQAWEHAWRRHWPRTSAREAARLAALAQRLRLHLDAFARAPLPRAWEERRALRERLRWVFRRSFQQPAAALAYLAILALDLERLRAELVGRALFAMPEGRG